MSVFIAFAVADVFHESGNGVAEVQGNGIGFGFLHVVDDFAIGSVNGIGLWSECEIDGGLGEGEMAFGSAKKIESIFCGESDRERAGFGQADVFTGHAHHAAGEIERVFARFDHAREPIERGVGIGIADGLVERGDEIEMLLAGFVVTQKFALQNVFEEFAGDDARTALSDAGSLAPRAASSSVL